MLFFPEKVDRVFTNNKEIRGHNVPVKSLVILLLCWLIPIFVMLPSYFNGGTGLNLNTGSCTFIKEEGKQFKTIFYIVGFVIPSFLLIVSDIAIYFKLKDLHKNDHRMSVAM